MAVTMADTHFLSRSSRAFELRLSGASDLETQIAKQLYKGWQKKLVDPCSLGCDHVAKLNSSLQRLGANRE